MNSTLPGKVFKEMADIFEELLDSLSTLHALSTIHLPVASEKELFRQIMVMLIENYGFDTCSVFVIEKKKIPKGRISGNQESRTPRESPTRPPASQAHRLAVALGSEMCTQPAAPTAAIVSASPKPSDPGAPPVITRAGEIDATRIAPMVAAGPNRARRPR